MNRIILLALSLCLSASVFAQKGYNIRVKLDNYPEKDLILGFHYGEKQYVKDTVQADKDGFFVFKADTMFPPGVYLLVLLPDKRPVEVMLNKEDQDFTLITDAKEPVSKMKVKDSEDNELFYKYLQFIGGLRPEADTLRAQMSRAKTKKDSAAITEKLTKMDERVKKYQQDYITKYPNLTGAKIVKASIEPEIPEFTGTDDKDKQRKRYYYYRGHYFDNINLADPVFLRSPLLHTKLDNFISKVAPQHPDSLNAIIDELFKKMEGSPETRRYYISHYLNYFAKMQLVGFDACYVHIGKNYFCTATWPAKEDLEKICDNVRRLEPILIGKIAPNIVVKDRNNQPHALYDVDADYTILFFWAPDCGHCKKAAPHLVEFAKKWKDRGVKIFNVCTAVTDKGPDCWKGVEEKGFDDGLFMNMYDPYIQSRYKTLYDVQTTPQIFILDRKHEILMKRIGAEQLDKTMESLIEIMKERKKQGK
jgi:thiol-disulfide isomerase/thioredoxin